MVRVVPLTSAFLRAHSSPMLRVALSLAPLLPRLGEVTVTCMRCPGAATSASISLSTDSQGLQLHFAVCEDNKSYQWLCSLKPGCSDWRSLSWVLSQVSDSVHEGRKVHDQGKTSTCHSQQQQQSVLLPRS